MKIKQENRENCGERLGKRADLAKKKKETRAAERPKSGNSKTESQGFVHSKFRNQKKSQKGAEEEKEEMKTRGKILGGPVSFGQGL